MRPARLTQAAGLVALALAAQAAPAVAQAVPSSDQAWRFNITPYLWLPSAEANLRYNRPGGAGTVNADVRVDAFNILEALNFAAMFTAEARYQRFSLWTDFIYLNLGNSGSQVRSVDFVERGRNPISSSLNAGTSSSLSGSIWTLAGGYTLAQGSWGHVDLTAGFRLFALSASTNVNLTADIIGPRQTDVFNRVGRISRSGDIFDGVAGLRGRFELGRGFSLPFNLDVGGGGSNLTWQAAGGIGYQTGSVGVAIGYRYLSYDQGGSKLVQDLSFGGPFIAVSFSF